MLAKSKMESPTRMASDVAILLFRVVSLLLPFIMKTKAVARLPIMATNAMTTRYFMQRIIA